MIFFSRFSSERNTIFNQENEQENERGRAADNDWASARQSALWAPSEKSRSFPERPRPVKSQNLASSRLTAKRMSDAASTHPQGPSIFRQCNAAGPFSWLMQTLHAIGKRKESIPVIIKKGTERNGLMHETNAHDGVHPPLTTSDTRHASPEEIEPSHTQARDDYTPSQTPRTRGKLMPNNDRTRTQARRGTT